MDFAESIMSALKTPMVLAFFLGVIASLIRSDLKFPEGLYVGLTIYLLFSIGLKGGVKLSEITLREFYLPAVAAVFMCVLISLLAYFILRFIGKYTIYDSAAICAHYGSVSAVTFSAILSYLENNQIFFEGFMPSLVSLREKNETADGSPFVPLDHQLILRILP
jgi:hypothetical protein